MNTNYTFTLKDNKNALLVRVVRIWYVILLALLTLFSFSAAYKSIKTTSLIIDGLLIGAGVCYYLMSKQKNSFLAFCIFIFIASIISIYIFFGIYFTCCFILFAVFIFWFAKQKTIISFVDDRVELKNGFIKRTIDWGVLNNVVLKDGILTLDFKSDKLIQEEIIDLDECNVADFNSKMQLHLKQ